MGATILTWGMAPIVVAGATALAGVATTGAEVGYKLGTGVINNAQASSMIGMSILSGMVGVVTAGIGQGIDVGLGALQVDSLGKATYLNQGDVGLQMISGVSKAVVSGAGNVGLSVAQGVDARGLQSAIFGAGVGVVSSGFSSSIGAVGGREMGYLFGKRIEVGGSVMRADLYGGSWLDYADLGVNVANLGMLGIEEAAGVGFLELNLRREGIRFRIGTGGYDVSEGVSRAWDLSVGALAYAGKLGIEALGGGFSLLGMRGYGVADSGGASGGNLPTDFLLRAISERAEDFERAVGRLYRGAEAEIFKIWVERYSGDRTVIVGGERRTVSEDMEWMMIKRRDGSMKVVSIDGRYIEVVDSRGNKTIINDNEGIISRADGGRFELEVNESDRSVSICDRNGLARGSATVRGTSDIYGVAIGLNLMLSGFRVGSGRTNLVRGVEGDHPAYDFNTLDQSGNPRADVEYTSPYKWDCSR